MPDVRYCTFEKARQRYVFQMRVPTDLRDHYPSAMLKKHLGKRAAPDVAQEAGRLARQYRDEFARLRRRHGGQQAVATATAVLDLTLDDDMAARFVATWQSDAATAMAARIEQLSEADDGAWQAEAMALAKELAAARQALRRQHSDVFDTARMALERRLAIGLVMSAPQRTLAVQSFNSGRVNFLQQALAVLDGERPVASLLPAADARLPIAELWGHPASALMSSWETGLRRGNRPVNPKTRDKFAVCADGLAQVLGRRCVESVNRGDLVAVVANWQQAGNCYKTLDTKLGNLVTLLRPFVPATRLGELTGDVLPARPKVNEAHRLPFRDNQLRQLLNVLALPDVQPDDFRLFCLMLMTGARREEICQLTAADCGYADGVASVTIADQRQTGMGTTAIKNTDSARVLPLRLNAVPGLADWFTARLAEGGPLFPDLVADTYGDFGSAASKRLNRRIDRHLGRDRRLVLQSTRHTIAGVLRRAGVDARVRRRFLGHGDAGLHERVYDPGERLEFADLIPGAEAIAEYLAALFASTAVPTVVASAPAPVVATVQPDDGHDGALSRK